MSKTVLVTGGTSHLGSHIAAALKERGHRPVIFDDLTASGGAAAVDGVAVVNGTLGDRAALHALFAAHRFDGVIYVPAAETNDRRAAGFGRIGDPVAGMIGLIGTACEHDVRRFVLSADGAIFGHPCRLPIDEDEAIETTTSAGETNHLIEELLARAQALHGLAWTCLRYGAVVGFHPDRFAGMASEPETGLVARALAVAEGRRLYVDIPGTSYPTADGTLVRDYVHVCDLAAAHVCALEALESGGHRFNVSLDRGYSVHEVLGTVRRMTGATIPARAAAAVAGEPPAIVLTAARIRRELGWVPQYPDLDSIISTAWAARDRHPRRAAVA